MWRRMQAGCEFKVWNASPNPDSLLLHGSNLVSSVNAVQKLSVCSAYRERVRGRASIQWSLKGSTNSFTAGGGWGFCCCKTAANSSCSVEIGKRSTTENMGCELLANALGKESSEDLASDDAEPGTSYILGGFDNGVATSSSSVYQIGEFEPLDGLNAAAESKAAISSCSSSSIVPVGSSHAGLFRTPISGGVQSATSCHGLPHPAVAVRNLIEQAPFAHLCTIMSRLHHRRKGYPFGTLVDFAADTCGHPIFSMSPLAIHTRNLLADPRCTLVVQIPGWSGLANARVTLFGDVYPLPNDRQDWAHKHYTFKQQHCASQQWGNFHYYRMETISDIYFVGGFGTVAWVDVEEYERAQPDAIAANGAEQTLKEMNRRFSRSVRDMLSVETEIDDAALISIDSKGTDVRVRYGAKFNVQRLSFEEGCAVETLDQAITALQKILDKGPKQMPRKV